MTFSPLPTPSRSFLPPHLTQFYILFKNKLTKAKKNNQNSHTHHIRKKIQNKTKSIHIPISRSSRPTQKGRGFDKGSLRLFLEYVCLRVPEPEGSRVRMYVQLQWRERRPWKQWRGRGGHEGWDCVRTESTIKTYFYTQEAVMAIIDAGQGRAMTELPSLNHRRRGRGLQPVEARSTSWLLLLWKPNLVPCRDLPEFHTLLNGLCKQTCVFLGWVIVALETFICLHVALSLSALISQESISIGSPPFPNPLTFLRLFCEGKGELGPTAGTAPHWLISATACFWTISAHGAFLPKKFLCCPGCTAMEARYTNQTVIVNKSWGNLL